MDNLWLNCLFYACNKGNMVAYKGLNRAWLVGMVGLVESLLGLIYIVYY